MRWIWMMAAGSAGVRIPGNALIFSGGSAWITNTGSVLTYGV